MLKIKRVDSKTNPPKFINLGNGNWYYNHDIQSEVVTTASEEDSDVVTEDNIFSYIPVKITGRPDYKRCVEAVIRACLTQSMEFDLINSYNRVLLGQISGEEAEKARNDYTQYLEILAGIKSKVRADFDARDAELGARGPGIDTGLTPPED